MLKFFGKRQSNANLPPQSVTRSKWGPSEAPDRAPADADGISRIFSKELFEGEVGEFLKAAGISPDSPGNIAQTNQTFATLDARHKAELKSAVAAMNTQFKGKFRIVPFFLMPEAVWRGRWRNFLLATCRLYPADPSNVFFLASDEATARVTRLPMHPSVSDQACLEKCEEIVGALGKLYDDAVANGEAHAGSIAFEASRGLGLLQAAIRFSSDAAARETDLFGPLPHRSIASFMAFANHGK